QDVRVIESPKNRKAFTVYSKRWPLKIELPSRRGTYRKKTDDFTLLELHQQIRNIDDAYPHFSEEDRARKRSAFRVELHKRLALSAACFSFVVLGIPLGIRAHRKESSIGIGLSLILIFNFYIFL
ncbi:MAG: LptF/LptG family permease, partial [Gammaproteobacteria bacterium]|nr:LptF/LptG family permease [Gammaproteobacteria bacterium]